MCRTPLATALLAISLSACVPVSHVASPPDDRLMITQAEISMSMATNAFDVIHNLRANFLSLRGETSLSATSSPYPTVYVDGMRYGNLETLRGIPSTQIASIRLYRAWDAMTRFGDGNMGGVIAVTTKLDTR